MRRPTPPVVVVDSFRTIVRKQQGGHPEMELQTFIQRLALFLASWQATTFLVGEYTEDEMRDNPIFTVADGLFLLSQANSCSGCLRMPAAKRAGSPILSRDIQTRKVDFPPLVRRVPTPARPYEWPARMAHPWRGAAFAKRGCIHSQSGTASVTFPNIHASFNTPSQSLSKLFP